MLAGKEPENNVRMVVIEMMKEEEEGGREETKEEETAIQMSLSEHFLRVPQKFNFPCTDMFCFGFGGVWFGLVWFGLVFLMELRFELKALCRRSII
jgi:hypothetical protein